VENISSTASRVALAQAAAVQAVEQAGRAMQRLYGRMRLQAVIVGRRQGNKTRAAAFLRALIAGAGTPQPAPTPVYWRPERTPLELLTVKSLPAP
jgi:hypothetical protein